MAKRKALSFELKLEVIACLEKGEKQIDVCRKLGLAGSTVRGIWSSKEKIKSTYCSYDNKESKRMRTTKHEDLDQALLKWFKEQRSSDTPLSGHIMLTKAQQLAELMNLDFECSSGWIDRFKKRHNIVFGKICGEAKEVNQSVPREWIATEWPKIIDEYGSENIFNGDETGLFYKLAPQNTLKFKGEKCIGGKLSKERITVFVCANMTGTEKRDLLVIGKSRNPRCFKSVKRLPVKYRTNKKAWMTSAIFEEEIRNWDEELVKKRRKIALLVDNCTAHPKIKELKSIKLIFLPPNCTSVLQPMDQGVIKSLKAHYRKKLAVCILQEQDTLNFGKVTLLDACRFLQKAWIEVSESTIAHCFNHAGLSTNPENLDDDMPLSEWIQQYNIPQDLQSFISFNEDVITNGTSTDQEIISQVLQEKNTDENEMEAEVEVEDGPQEPPTYTEALNQVSQLISFYECKRENNSDDTILLNLYKISSDIERKFLHSRKVQKSINDFFK